MDKKEKKNKPGRNEEEADEKDKLAEKKELKEEDVDEELEQTFPASDPPSYSKPGNDKKGEK